MRRFTSILLLVLGGWIAITQLMAAFFDIEPGLADNFWMTAIMAVFAALFLLLGAWASPGRRWHEVGLTLLISAGIGAISGLTALLIFNDPKFMELMPKPLPRIDLAPAFGVVNLLLVGALGWWLYRERVREANSVIE